MEFAAVLPVVAIALLLVAQMGVLVSEQLAVQHAAREGARVAAIENDDAAARNAALRAGNLDPERASIDITPSSRDVGAPVRVEIHYTPAVMPFIDTFVPTSWRLTATVEMRTERARAG